MKCPGALRLSDVSKGAAGSMGNARIPLLRRTYQCTWLLLQPNTGPPGRDSPTYLLSDPNDVCETVLLECCISRCLGIASQFTLNSLCKNICHKQRALERR